MYERFSDRARKVMILANQEAQRFNHEYIGTEHVLLGLVKEGSGVAANVLRNLGLDLRKIRLEIEKLVQSGPEMVTMGKLPQTPRTKKVIEYAMEESRNLKHNYVGTEHVLLGLLREQEGVAAQILENLGLDMQKVREELLNLLGCERGYVEQLATDEEAAEIFDRAANVRLLNDAEVRELFRKKMEEAVCNQDFQQAAELRDQMKRCSCGESGCCSAGSSSSADKPMVLVLRELKQLLIQQAETTTQMLQLLKNI